MLIKGYAKKGKKTKQLVKRLKPYDIAVIDHQDLDEVAAGSLIESRVKAVINCAKNISGRYPTKGAQMLVEQGVVLVDDIGEQFYDEVQEKDIIEIKHQTLFINSKPYGPKIQQLDRKKVAMLLRLSQTNIEDELKKFVNNTLDYAKKEKERVLSSKNMPNVLTTIKGRHVLIVVRGCNYKEDLKTIRGYIKDFRPVLIGVDGGGDALLAVGLIPDIIIGDMDSVSDVCLKRCKEVIVHAYADGQAPGLERIKQLGLAHKVFPFPGTSEDIAMLLAYEKGADLIVAVGTHSNMIDFLEKGRRGMASTMLIRLKVGAKLVDARGVNKLYANNLKLAYCIPILISVLIPIFAVIQIYIPLRAIIHLFQIRFGFGG